jgi:hypothetical protein
VAVEVAKSANPQTSTFLLLPSASLAVNSMSRISTTPWSARESSFSKPGAVTLPPGNSIARKSTGPSSSSDPGWDA